MCLPNELSRVLRRRALSLRRQQTHQKPAASLALAALAVLAFAGTAVAQQQVPFRGSIQGAEIDEVLGTTPQGGLQLLVDGSGTGNATHLGRFTATWEFMVPSGIGSYHFIAANGDSIFTEVLAQAEPTGTPGVVKIVELHTITGGTGRFTGATGSFILERLNTIVSLVGDQLTVTTSGSFNGTISSPGG
jgi:hypothetical protein